MAAFTAMAFQNSRSIFLSPVEHCNFTPPDNIANLLFPRSLKTSGFHCMLLSYHRLTKANTASASCMHSV